MEEYSNIILPIHKNYKEPSVFTPENLLREARRQKHLEDCRVPEICILDPDGDLVNYLIEKKQARLHKGWACYHTQLYSVNTGAFRFGILGCVVGAPFAVLVAEQLFVSGCKMLISVTSSGIIMPIKKAPKFILIEEAIRDEGTSYHYLPPDETSHINPCLSEKLMAYFHSINFPIKTGNSWTTDAPYRETRSAIKEAKKLNVTGVEMEAAALYAFAKARNKTVVCFAHLTNTMAQKEGDFEKGADMGAPDTLKLVQHAIKSLQSFETGKN